MVAWPLLQGLTEEHQKKVLAASRRRTFDRNEVVFHEGDPGDALHLVASGHFAVRVSTPLGDLATLTVVGAGDFFGELALVSPGHVRTATVVALDPAETRALHRAQFAELRRRNPWVDRFLVQTLAARNADLNRLLLQALYVPADRRIARRLLDLGRLFGADAHRATIPLTQEEIATTAGVARPTANRVLRALEDAGTVSIQRGRIEILEPEELRRHAT